MIGDQTPDDAAESHGMQLVPAESIPENVAHARPVPSDTAVRSSTHFDGSARLDTTAYVFSRQETPADYYQIIHTLREDKYSPGKDDLYYASSSPAHWYNYFLDHKYCVEVENGVYYLDDITSGVYDSFTREEFIQLALAHYELLTGLSRFNLAIESTAGLDRLIAQKSSHLTEVQWRKLIDAAKHVHPLVDRQVTLGVFKSAYNQLKANDQCHLSTAKLHAALMTAENLLHFLKTFALKGLQEWRALRHSASYEYFLLGSEVVSFAKLVETFNTLLSENRAILLLSGQPYNEETFWQQDVNCAGFNADTFLAVIGCFSRAVPLDAAVFSHVAAHFFETLMGDAERFLSHYFKKPILQQLAQHNPVFQTVLTYALLKKKFDENQRESPGRRLAFNIAEPVALTKKETHINVVIITIQPPSYNMLILAGKEFYQQRQYFLAVCTYIRAMEVVQQNIDPKLMLFVLKLVCERKLLIFMPALLEMIDTRFMQEMLADWQSHRGIEGVFECLLGVEQYRQQFSQFIPERVYQPHQRFNDVLKEHTANLLQQHQSSVNADNENVLFLHNIWGGIAELCAAGSRAHIQALIWQYQIIGNRRAVLGVLDGLLEQEAVDLSAILFRVYLTLLNSESQPADIKACFSYLKESTKFTCCFFRSTCVEQLPHQRALDMLKPILQRTDPLPQLNTYIAPLAFSHPDMLKIRNALRKRPLPASQLAQQNNHVFSSTGETAPLLPVGSFWEDPPPYTQAYGASSS